MSASKTPADARDPRVDAYIAAAAPFARAPLEHVRAAMHAALPAVTEAIKWGHPFYLLDGKPFASMAAFKYVEWIVEAKREATRAARVAQALEWIAEGKSRHWKYQAA